EFGRRWKEKTQTVGVGHGCGMEKGSFGAACAEVAVDRSKGTIAVKHDCQTFECGAITHPANLISQNQGAIVMGIGPALREGMQFDEGKVKNASFWSYEVPRFADVPKIEVNLLDRRDLPASGA